MKIRIELNQELAEEEIVINCKDLNDTIKKIQESVSDIIGGSNKLSLYKEDKEFYIPIDEILFFETDDNIVNAHTTFDVLQAKYKLYELETILPNSFLRVSKSTILNTNHILSIKHNLTSASLVEFAKSHKQVYVSRYYYKFLREKLNWRERK